MLDGHEGIVADSSDPFDVPDGFIARMRIPVINDLDGKGRADVGKPDQFGEFCSVEIDLIV